MHRSTGTGTVLARIIPYHTITLQHFGARKKPAQSSNLSNASVRIPAPPRVDAKSTPFAREITRADVLVRLRVPVSDSPGWASQETTTTNKQDDRTTRHLGFKLPAPPVSRQPL
jgi:hypothetical protein